MSRELKQITSAVLVILMTLGPATLSFGRGGGGRGGGGGGRGGGGGGARMGGGGGARMGGGMSRPSPSMGRSPSMSRPPSMASRPAGGGRPAAGARPSLPSSRPSGLTPGSRPGSVNFPTAGTRPATPGLTPGSRPGVGTLPSTRPGVGSLPSTRPGVGTLPSTRPGVGTPGIGTPGAGRPGISQLPANTGRLPGLGNRPDIGARPSQLPNRTPQQRRDQLQDRLGSRDQIADREHIRQDWLERYDNFYERHGDWHHGCWPGHGGGWWNHMWSEHTALMAWGTTMWGLNRLAYGFGYWGYDNPYYSEDYSYPVDYSQPLPEEVPVEQPAGAHAPGMAEFDAAREAFFKGDYPTALALTDKALSALPSDPIIHEFRSLVLFALGKYPESAAGLYSVLSVGPGWDWTTMISLYPNVDAYTKQLRGLENYVKQNPDAADARFVLAYQYLTQGNTDAAAGQYKKLYDQTPQDLVIKELVLMTAGPEAVGAPTTPEAPATPAVSINAAELVGKWSATGQGGTKFTLDLTQDGGFTWTYSENGKTQSVKGVYAVDGNVLAMEPDTGGTLVAEVTPPSGGSFGFQVLGAPPGDPGLKFAKAR